MRRALGLALWLGALAAQAETPQAPAASEGSAAPLPAAAAETERLTRSGAAVVGAQAPWFAGWTPAGQVLNRTAVLAQPGARHVVVLFATWCRPCEVGLRALAAARGALAAAGLSLTLVAVSEPPEVVTPWLAARGLAGVPVLLDKFGAAAQALAGRGAAGETIALPRTILMDRAGTVRAIFGREGPDYVPALLATARDTPPPTP